MAKILLLILAALLSFSGTVFSQDKYSGSDFGKRFFGYNPAIEMSYGVSDINLPGFAGVISNAGMLELKLGYSSQKKSNYGENILKYNHRYLFLANASSDLYSKGSSGIGSEMWRFGFGNKEGYGIKLGSFSIHPYTSGSFAWSEFDYKNISTEQIDYSALNDFNDAFRFGSMSEAGINLQITKGISIQPKYEIADIYPRHLFAKQMMSSMIEIGGKYLIYGFTHGIMRRSPVAGTIVSFILVNAYEYGFYQLRKEQMNWPFTSVAPLRYSTFKVGMTFTF